jgi:hypothetical protein
LNAPAYQSVSVTCPNCQRPFVTPVLSILDVGQNPELKGLLLSGGINIAVCPHCGHAGALRTPLVYHDPEKELLLTWIPTEMGLPELEQQRIIGDLTNRVISALPSEQRKGYLLQPRTFLRLEGMIEAILQADGITPEMLEAQRAKAALLERLLQATSEDTRRVIAQENDAQIDYEFFQLLTMNLELADAGGHDEVVRQLLGLRDQLLKWTTTGREAAARQEAIASLGSKITREGLLEKLVEFALAGEQAKVETLVAVGRPAIDYIFYQQLTARIDAAQSSADLKTAETLRELRETVLDLTAQIDAEVQQATAEAEQLLQEILEAGDLKEAVEANVELIDELFLSVLAARLDAAERAGKSADAEKLGQVANIIMELIQESQPPEIQFINELLAADYPDGTLALLKDNPEEVTANLLDLMRLLREDLTKSGRADTAQRLSEIEKQAAAIVG